MLISLQVTKKYALDRYDATFNINASTCASIPSMSVYSQKGLRLKIFHFPMAVVSEHKFCIVVGGHLTSKQVRSVGVKRGERRAGRGAVRGRAIAACSEHVTSRLAPRPLNTALCNLQRNALAATL